MDHNVLTSHLVGILMGAIVIIVHYEVLAFLWRRSSLSGQSMRVRMLAVIFCLFLAHGLEIWSFALGLWVSHTYLDMGSLVGTFDGSVRDTTPILPRSVTPRSASETFGRPVIFVRSSPMRP